MLEELNSASEQLRAALEHYLHVCSSLKGATLHGISSSSAREIERELELAGSYDTTMQHAKVAIKVARNHTSSIVPINSLPREILLHIFSIARDAELCHVGRLALVCSHWRSIALKSCIFWSHIDYNPDSSRQSYTSQLDRAHLQVSRSGKVPLEFHISAESKTHDSICDTKTRRLCELVAPRMTSLHLDLEGLNRQLGQDKTHYVLSALLSNCVAGVLTKLVVVDSYCFGFLDAKDETPGDSSLKVLLNCSALDKIFTPITTLHLTGLFPRWKSQVYHGLVDLRLYACRTAVPFANKNLIRESHLVTILNASPGLRILYFQLRIIHESEYDQPRVRLVELEELQLEAGLISLPFLQVEHFLRLLEPGPKPLSLSIQRYDIRSGVKVPIKETLAFFARSNVTKLHITEFPKLLELLSSLPHLKDLILTGHKQWDRSNLPILEPSVTYPQLNTCLLSGCTLPLDDLLQLVWRCKLQTVTFDNSEFYRHCPEEQLDEVVVNRVLLAVRPDIKTITVHTAPDLTA